LEQHLNRQLLEHLERAYHVLKTVATRQSYRRQLFDGEFIIFGSDILRQKGESLLFTKEELDNAILELQAAIEVYDKDSEYWAALGLALFIKHHPRQIAEAEEGRRMVRKALAMKSDSELNNLCMGMLYKHEKRNPQALEQMEKVLKINPKNRFAAIEAEEIKTGRRHADYETVVREFVERRSKADRDFDKKMEAKRKAAAEKKE
jgi:tetratricopeptide (TPR) repeat protein